MKITVLYLSCGCVIWQSGPERAIPSHCTRCTFRTNVTARELRTITPEDVTT